VLHEFFHLLYVTTNEKQEVHHPHPVKMHEQPDLIGIKARKPPLTTEILHDQFHEWGILISKKSESKNSGELVQIVGLNVRLIMMPLHLLLIMPLFFNVWYACCR